jgi:hypothetical protein
LLGFYCAEKKDTAAGCLTAKKNSYHADLETEQPVRYGQLGLTVKGRTYHRDLETEQPVRYGQLGLTVKGRTAELRNPKPELNPRKSKLVVVVARPLA